MKIINFFSFSKLYVIPARFGPIFKFWTDLEGSQSYCGAFICLFCSGIGSAGEFEKSPCINCCEPQIVPNVEESITRSPQSPGINPDAGSTTIPPQVFKSCNSGPKFLTTKNLVPIF